jgi:molybdopterin synthase catalytic subunit
MDTVRVQDGDFDVGAEMAALLGRCAGAGGIGCFVGVVRSLPDRPVSALTLEHYPAMTGPALAHIAAEATARFGLLGCTVIHRVGRLEPGAQIVLVLAAAPHRGEALEATAYLIDWLKTAAPFWKKEHLASGAEEWVEARAQDDEAASRW